jgi:septum formation protein
MIKWTAWPFQVAPSNIDESVRKDEKPQDYVRRLAFEKSMAAIEAALPGDVIIAADTIVILDDRILGKPVDAQNAFVMLESLRNRMHLVVTAISVRLAGRKDALQDICRSNVRMRNYSNEEIEAYVSSGDPLDKAGGYAIQNPRFNPVGEFSGCFASVMGMPLCHLERTMRKLPDYRDCDMAEVCWRNLKYRCPITRRVLAGEDIG